MNTLAHQRLRRMRRVLVAGAVVALMMAAGFAWLSPRALLPAYRFAALACFGPAIGSLLFVLIHRTTGGQWGDALAPYLVTGVRFAPWLWLLVLPNLFFTPNSAAGWPDYNSRAMFALRGSIYAVLFFGTTALLSRGDRKAPAWIGPVGLIVLVFALHLLADDWLAAVGGHWHSTAFPLVWMTGQAVAGLGCAVLAALACGASPNAVAGARRALGFDWGNLLLAAMLVWCYIAFAQFLIIWAGNLPREISWFVTRERGGWRIVPAALAVLHFFVPLAILLSRDFKRSTPMLAGVAALLVFAQLVYGAWLILPAFPVLKPSGIGVELALGAAAFALFLERYLAAGAARTEAA